MTRSASDAASQICCLSATRQCSVSASGFVSTGAPLDQRLEDATLARQRHLLVEQAPEHLGHLRQRQVARALADEERILGLDRGEDVLGLLDADELGDGLDERLAHLAHEHVRRGLERQPDPFELARELGRDRQAPAPERGGRRAPGDLVHVEDVGHVRGEDGVHVDARPEAGRPVDDEAERVRLQGVLRPRAQPAGGDPGPLRDRGGRGLEPGREVGLGQPVPDRVRELDHRLRRLDRRQARAGVASGRRRPGRRRLRRHLGRRLGRRRGRVRPRRGLRRGALRGGDHQAGQREGGPRPTAGSRSESPGSRPSRGARRPRGRSRACPRRSG